MYSYISFSGKQREHSDWWRKIYDLPHSIDGCWQGLRSVEDGALVWEDGRQETDFFLVLPYVTCDRREEMYGGMRHYLLLNSTGDIGIP